MPRARISGTGAIPEPSLRFEPGQCITLMSWSPISSCSRSSTQTQCAAHRCGDARWTLARYSKFVMPPEIFLTMAISSRDSEACVCTSACCSSDRLPTASSSSREHDTANRGANAACRRPFSAPCQCLRIATLSSSDDRVASLRRLGTSASESIMHLPIVARRPLSATASNTTSVSCTVSIVRTAVVPLDRSSVAASRAAARRVVGVCAASMGRIRVRSQSISGRSSANPRNSVWQR